MLTSWFLYLFTFTTSLILSLIFTPSARSAAIVLHVFDHPSTPVKTHKQPVPYLGGTAIFAAFAFSLLWVRVLTSFPTGTLRALRGILTGGFMIFLLGLVDDVKHHGLHYRTKFAIQILAALFVTLFGVRIRFIQPPWLAYCLTVVWIVGVTNAFNLIDIMDGLASGVACVASLAFLFIALPTEDIYVNFASAALAGAVLGFFPYNTSKNWRIFMGDSGSLLLGFVLSALALGTSYGAKTEVEVFAPILILAVPIFDTLLVFYLRIRRGVSPFLGSKDHFPLRLETIGWSRKHILVFVLALALVLCFGAYTITQVNLATAVAIYAGCAILLVTLTVYVLKAKVN